MLIKCFEDVTGSGHRYHGLDLINEGLHQNVITFPQPQLSRNNQLGLTDIGQSRGDKKDSENESDNISVW